MPIFQAFLAFSKSFISKQETYLITIINIINRNIIILLNPINNSILKFINNNKIIIVFIIFLYICLNLSIVIA